MKNYSVMVTCPRCDGEGQDPTGCPDYFGIVLCDLCNGAREVPAEIAAEYEAEDE